MKKSNGLSAYILPTGALVSPFEEPPGKMRVLNRSLRECQTEALAQCGTNPPVEIASLKDMQQFPCLLIHDHVFFTRALLHDFIKLAQLQNRPSRCAIAPSLFVENTCSLQELTRYPEGGRGALYDIWYLTGPVAAPEELCALPPIPIDPKEKVREANPPPLLVNAASPRQIAFTSRQALHLRHWAVVLRANLGAFAAKVVDQWELHPGRIATRYLLDKLIGRFRHRRLSRMGKGCRIHPTALVEGCLLGDGVKVSAHAIVRGSVLGPQTTVEEGAQVYFSVIGARSWVARSTIVFMCVMYDDVFSSHRVTQSSLFGHRVCTTSGGFLIDLNFQGAVKAIQGGKPVDAGTNFLGCCLGHDVKMGTGIWIQAGREIPNGLTLIRDPNEVLHRIPEGTKPGSIMVVKNGTLEPLP